MPSDRKIKIEVDGTIEWLLLLIVINLAFISFSLGGIKDALKQQPAKIEQETKK